ncbi:Uncharacterised protein [Legionella beliardensis]|uniref:Uncharacterized protein n=1 Tax=Legionella beliardensis TaxID=91822 RepID=A0A378JXX5_9GAMM|nr:hypothetical protein [Legionella beliardensis]STX55601.1 Uncharacterised protein [Legionella beliardensis]
MRQIGLLILSFTLGIFITASAHAAQYSREMTAGSFYKYYSAVSPEPLDPTFFANSSFQNLFPGASVLHFESRNFLEESLLTTYAQGDALISAIRSEPGLAELVVNFPQLSELERIQVMNRIFTLQVMASGMPAPELLLDNSARKSTFFQFDPTQPGTGKVILNPVKLFADANPHAALLFLIHETRHSYQFQIGFSGIGSVDATAYQSGFLAQKQVFDQELKISFCDFLTLNHEYEAFLFGNYVMEVLTSGVVKTADMGTLASQYLTGLGLRLDLPKLARETDSQDLLDAFNELEKTQYEERSRG